MESHRFARELDVEYGYHFLVPFPGTEVRDDMARYDLELLTDNWNDFDANRAIVRTAGLSSEAIEQFVKTFYLDEVEKEEARMEKGLKDGTLDYQEQLRCLGKQKLDIVFKLLSEDILENAPPFPSDNGRPPAKALSRYLADVVDKPLDMVDLSIHQFLDRGYLHGVEQGQQTVWHWR